MQIKKIEGFDEIFIACAAIWHIGAITLHPDTGKNRYPGAIVNELKKCDMKNTEFNLDTLSAIISSEDSLLTLEAMIADMGLEVREVVKR